MCFYEQYVYQCRDWKWGSFRQHCQAEFRTGHNCGNKMVWQAIPLQEKCKLCMKIETKERRRAKHVDNYNKWRQEPHRYQASIEKALEDIKALEHEINNLRSEKNDRYARVGNARHEGMIPPHPQAASSLSQPASPRAASPTSTHRHASKSKEDATQHRELVDVGKSLKLHLPSTLASTTEQFGRSDESPDTVQPHGLVGTTANIIRDQKLTEARKGSPLSTEELVPLLAAGKKDPDPDVERLQQDAVHRSWFNREAYSVFKMKLLDHVHELYERRVKLALGHDLIGPQGTNLDPNEIDRIACEISWVPPRLLTFSHESGYSYPNTIKSTVEQSLGETWNWWPFAPRLHLLRQGYYRLQWKSPCGMNRHLDLPLSTQTAVQKFIDIAPTFINRPTEIRSHLADAGFGAQSSSTSSNNERSSTQAGSNGAMSNPVVSGSSSPPQQNRYPTPIAVPGHGSAHQISQPSPPRQYLSVCIVSSSRKFISLRCDDLSSDLEFFANMKAEYNKARGLLRIWLSMWQYNYSEFVLFHKYGYRRGARVDIGFPNDNDKMYQFTPRKPTPPPPNGPISKEQFQDHYYLDHCPSMYDWRRYQLRYRGHFNKANRVALDAVPKRLVHINMDDGVNEYFYGLYSKEERSFLRVAIYACLCNSPAVIFFFLWLFQWGHGSDLQNASVPLSLSLSLTLGFAAVVFGTRDRL